jgi:hypothetical protein
MTQTPTNNKNEILTYPLAFLATAIPKNNGNYNATVAYGDSDSKPVYEGVSASNADDSNSEVKSADEVTAPDDDSESEVKSAEDEAKPEAYQGESDNLPTDEIKEPCPEAHENTVGEIEVEGDEEVVEEDCYEEKDDDVEEEDEATEVSAGLASSGFKSALSTFAAIAFFFLL